MTWKRSYEVALPSWATAVTAYKPPAGFLAWGIGTGLYPCRLMDSVGATVAEGNLGGDGHGPLDVAGVEGGAVMLSIRTVAGTGDDYTTHWELSTLSDAGGALVVGAAVEIARLESVGGVGTAFTNTELPGDHCIPDGVGFAMAAYGNTVCVLGVWRRGVGDAEHAYLIGAVATYTTMGAAPTVSYGLHDCGTTIDNGTPQHTWLSKGTGSGFVFAMQHVALKLASVGLDATVTQGTLLLPDDIGQGISVGPEVFAITHTGID